MLHEPAPASEEPDHSADEKARLGVKLFLVYSLVYAGFIVIATLRPKWMGLKTLAGLNLAVVYGFGLILLAIVMGMIYHAICSRMEDDAKQKADAFAAGGQS